MLWGQFCLFRCVRLQDDVFDGDARDRSGIFLADLYLLEAERTFARHFPYASEFWRIFRGSREATASAILEVDRLQRSATRTEHRLLGASARVDSIFRVGLSAVCLKHGRPGVLRKLVGAMREAGLAAQIFDDLTDVAQDLRRRRRNYAARIAAVHRRSARPAASSRATAPATLTGDGVLAVIGEAQRRLDRAARLLRGLPCPDTQRSVAQSIEAADALARAVHRRRVRAAFGRRGR